MKVFKLTQELGLPLPSEIHIVPIGEWKERDFRVTAEDCADIVRNFNAFGTKLVIDYEHQTLNSKDNGAPAPAAGWIGRLEQRENGVWGSDLEWTPEAAQFLQNKQYRYLSPVIVFDDHDPHDGTLIGCSLHSVALTNTPYFQNDLVPVVSKNDPPHHSPITTQPNKENPMTLEEQIAALKADNAALVSKIGEMETALAAKDAVLAEQSRQRLVDDAIAAKKLLPAQKEVALIIAAQGSEAFEKFIAANVIPDLGTPANVPKGPGSPEDLKAEYQELLKNPGALIQLSKENPERFEALRKAYYGG